MKNFLIRNKNITKTILIITAAMAVLAISISSIVLDRVVERHEEELIKFIAADIYDDISNELLRPVTLVRVISSDVYLKERLASERFFSREENISSFKKYLADIQKNFKCTSAYVVSEESKVYYTFKGFHKIIDVENNKHDIWYKLFVDSLHPYEFDVDVDEANKNNWTIFVSGRLANDNGKLLGVCGIGIDLTGLQNLFITTEQTYNVKINLVDQQGVIQVDTDSVNIEKAHSQNIINPNKSVQFVLNKKNGVYTITKYISDLGWYLVVRRDADATQGTFSHLVIYMVSSFVFATMIFLFFMHIALNIGQKQVEKTAKTHGLATYSNLYISMHLIDLQEQTISELSRDSDYKLFSINKYDTFNTQIINAVIEMTAHESLNKMLHFADLSTISERLKEHNVINCEFLSKNYGWCKAYFIATEFDENQKISQIIFAIELIDEEKNRENNLIYLSQTDLMTGLKNRGSGEKAFKEMVENGVAGTFFMMDADKFKSINDNYGHDVGDKVIKAIADCLKKTFRAGDVVMRLGGDEFAAYAVGIVDAAEVKILVEKFFAAIDAINIPELGGRKISISLGSTTFHAEENISPSKIYKHADLAAYESKKVKGNFHTVY